MPTVKEAAAEFLACERIAVTGVSRSPGDHGANAVYKRLRERGYEVFAVNPNADEVEGDVAYQDLKSIPGGVGAVVIAGALGGTFAAADSVILVGSILAQVLLDNKKVETWVVWFAVDVVAIWLYLTSGLAIAGLQYVLFLVTAVLGFRQWWVALHRRDGVPEPAS